MCFICWYSNVHLNVQSNMIKTHFILLLLQKLWFRCEGSCAEKLEISRRTIIFYIFVLPNLVMNVSVVFYGLRWIWTIQWLIFHVDIYDWQRQRRSWGFSCPWLAWRIKRHLLQTLWSRVKFQNRLLSSLKFSS